MDFLGPWTPIGLLLAAVAAVLSGLLWPLRTVKLMLADRDRQIADWKAAFTAEAERGRLRDAQTAELLELSRTGAKALQALTEMSRRAA